MPEKKFPTFLYRYRPINVEVLKRELDAIRQGYLWFSKFDQLNDPAELANAEPIPVPDVIRRVQKFMFGGSEQVADVMDNRAD